MVRSVRTILLLEVLTMNSENLWSVFCATGSVEHYLLYSSMKKRENRERSDNGKRGDTQKDGKV